MTREEIEKAIAGHGMWKMKLSTAMMEMKKKY